MTSHSREFQLHIRGVGQGGIRSLMFRSLWICFLIFSGSLTASELNIDDRFEQQNLTSPLDTALDIDSNSAEYMLENAKFDTASYQHSTSPNADTYWYRIQLSASQLKRPKNLVLLSQSHLLQHLDFYLFKDTTLIKAESLGILDRPMTNEPYKGVNFEFTIQDDEQLTLLIKKQSDGPAIMPLVLMDEPEFARQHMNTLFLWGGVIGMFLALAVYNGFIFSLNRHSSQYGWYLLLQLCMFLQFAPLHGFGYLIFPDVFCRWLGTHMGVFHLLMLWCVLRFGFHYLDIKKFRPTLGKLIGKSSWFFIILLVVSFQIAELQRMYVTSVLIVVVSYICISTAIIALKQKYSPALFYLLSWVCTFVGAAGGFLTYANVLPQNIVTLHSFMLGVLAELYLLSVGLAKRLQYQEHQDKQHRLIDQTLNMPNQHFYQYVLNDQFIARGIDIKRVKLILIYVEGLDHLISTLGNEIVTVETNTLLSKVAKPISELPWQLSMSLDQEHFGVCIPPQQTLIFVTDDENTETQIEKVLHIWQKQLASSIYFSDLYLRAASANLSDGDDGISSLHQKAYMALLEAQKSGLKWRQFNEKMTEKIESHVRILHDLRLAIYDQKIDIYIQPKFDLHTNIVVGGEALMRWTHPSLGMIPPSEFILIAEQSGLIHSLTRIAIEKMFAWVAMRRVDIQLSINISVLDLRQKDFIDFLQFKRDEFSVDAHYITFEITESQELENSSELIKRVCDIKQLGFAISIDDFGTGYSSMAYLSQLNIDEVKIDMMFVKSIENNVTNQKIVRILLNMADVFGAEVVIEGIETHKELTVIKRLGGKVGQGYYWSPAIDIKKFEQQYLHETHSIEC
ncbi:hypothetical protein DS893_11205 [Vibrionales bacterium C3R12]|nr:hypothetical protein DS893_11205 [Vibrionales bacterium C3R12]